MSFWWDWIIRWIVNWFRRLLWGSASTTAASEESAPQSTVQSVAVHESEDGRREVQDETYSGERESPETESLDETQVPEGVDDLIAASVAVHEPEDGRLEVQEEPDLRDAEWLESASRDKTQVPDDREETVDTDWTQRGGQEKTLVADGAEEFFAPESTKTPDGEESIATDCAQADDEYDLLVKAPEMELELSEFLSCDWSETEYETVDLQNRGLSSTMIEMGEYGWLQVQVGDGAPVDSSAVMREMTAPLPDGCQCPMRESTVDLESSSSDSDSDKEGKAANPGSGAAMFKFSDKVRVMEVPKDQLKALARKRYRMVRNPMKRAHVRSVLSERGGWMRDRNNKGTKYYYITPATGSDTSSNSDKDCQ